MVGLKSIFENGFTAAEHFGWQQQLSFPVCFASSATVSIEKRTVTQVILFQVIQKANRLDEALARMESHHANQQFKAIKKWQARHQSSVQREGGFLLFSQKKLAGVKAQTAGGEIRNGRDPATLQVPELTEPFRKLQSPGILSVMSQSVSQSVHRSCLWKESPQL